jgi:hypothetical protein
LKAAGPSLTVLFDWWQLPASLMAAASIFHEPLRSRQGQFFP